MKGLILAAGLGRRLHPLTRTTHKALVHVAGRAIASHLVDGLAAAGVDDIIVVTGHYARAVESHLRGHHPDTHFSFVHNDDFAHTNNIVSLAAGLGQAIDDDLLLAECDIMIDPALLAQLVASAGDVALVDRYRPGQCGTVVCIDELSRRVRELVPAAAQTRHMDLTATFKTVNIYRLSRAFVATLRTRLVVEHRARPLAFYETVFASLLAEGAVTMGALVAAPHYWTEIDDAADLATAEAHFASHANATR